MTTLPLLFGSNIDGLGRSTVPFAVCDHWNRTGHHSLLYAPSCEPEFRRPWLRPALGPIMKKIVHRLSTPEHIAERTRHLFYQQQSASPFVCLWTDIPLEVFEYFHNLDTNIIIECHNRHQAIAKTNLNEASISFDIPPVHDITEQSIEEERKKLSMATAIFCPSPMIYSSLLSEGIAENKLIRTSYDWSPEDFPALNPLPQDNRRPRFLFVGTLCLKTGVPLLLKAWVKANIKGELLLAGPMSDTIRNHYGGYFDRYEITHIPYTSQMGIYYNMCDIFVLPSLEESCSIATYEAMAHALVPVVSTMGAGEVVQDKASGLVLDNSLEQWVETFRSLAQNLPKRREIGHLARKRALEFTWEKVAASRANHLTTRFPSLWGER